MFVSFLNLICLIAMCEQILVTLANTVVKDLEFVNMKTPHNNHVKFEMWHATSKERM